MRRGKRLLFPGALSGGPCSGQMSWCKGDSDGSAGAAAITHALINVEHAMTMKTDGFVKQSKNSVRPYWLKTADMLAMGTNSVISNWG